MTQKQKGSPPNIMEYHDWVVTRKFSNSEEQHRHITVEEEEFLQTTIYPMFYENNDNQFKTYSPFPLILEDYSTKNPKYVIDNKYFTIVFFSYHNDNETCWELSMHIKNHKYCDERIDEFKFWFSKHCNRVSADEKNMPEEYMYSKLNIYSHQIEDFYIEFWNEGRNYMMFKLMDALRLF